MHINNICIVQKNKEQKGHLVEKLIHKLFFVLPFTLLINTILGGVRIAGIGVVNFFVDILLGIVFIDSLLKPQKYRKRVFIYAFMALFAFLHILKFLVSSDALYNYKSWFPQNQYYYFVPLVALALSNKKIDYDKISQNIVIGSWFISLFSIYMFLKTEYFGMITEQSRLQYDIVGTPYARMFSVFGSPNVAGAYFVFVILFCYYSYGVKRMWSKMLLLLNFICLILTFSKGSLLVLLVVFLCRYLYTVNSNILKRYIRIIFVVGVFIGVIAFATHNGIYFWQKKEIFQNVRIQKWEAGIQAIVSHWIVGNNFSQHIVHNNTWETTLSDNSFLLAMGYFGIPFVCLFVFSLNGIYRRLTKEKRKLVLPGIIGIIILCVGYDFLQMYPVNYISVSYIAYTLSKGHL